MTEARAEIHLTILVPCFNEEEVLEETMSRLRQVVEQLSETGKVNGESRIIFVDDGSRDRTWELIERAALSDTRIGGIKLSRNRGHQNALLAGLLNAPGDAVVSIDADLQDDVDVIEEMVDKYLKGAHIVYGVRKTRRSDTGLKRLTAEGYYSILRAMGVDVTFNHADFRLMSRQALDALKQYNEVNLFLRGIIPTIGYKTAIVEYDRHERFAGESKYPLRKMLALAIDGVTSFSAVPLRFIAILGLLVFLGSMILSAWVVWTRFISGDAIPGWASSVLPMYFLGGIQLLSIGVVGEYVAKIYMETKRRPRFFIENWI